MNCTALASVWNLDLRRQGRPAAGDPLHPGDASCRTLRSRILHLRTRLQDGGYDCPLKLSIALDRLIAAVVENSA